jgi:hypothetical protein
MTSTTTRRRDRDPRLVALSDDFLECRERHDWNGDRRVRRYRYPDKTLTVEVSTQCTRCDSTQVREIVTGPARGPLPLGTLYRQTRIDYAPGYLVKLEEGEERLPKASFRLEGVRRWLDANPDVPIVNRE